jgi:hypothetical protein
MRIDNNVQVLNFYDVYLCCNVPFYGFCIEMSEVVLEVRFILQQATKTQRRRRGIALLFP